MRASDLGLMTFVVCVPTTSGGHLTVAGPMNKDAAEKVCGRVKRLAPHMVKKCRAGPRCQFVHAADLADGVRPGEPGTLYSNDRPPHVSGGVVFEETILRTDYAYVHEVAQNHR